MTTPKTWLVTGGAGFIGSNFVLKARQSNWARVINLDLLTYAGNQHSLSSLAKDPGYTFVRGDICDSALVTSLLSQHQPDAIIHFAAESHVDRSIDGPGAFIRTNILGTQNLLDGAAAYQKGLSPEKQQAFRFHHISTDEVFGSLGPTDHAFSEATPYAPNSPYAASKAGSDHLVRAWHHTYGLPVTTTNCSNNYGPRQFPEKLIPLMIIKALKGEPLPIYGDGQNVRDWLHVDDHVDAIRLVLQRGHVGETYCVGGLCELKNIDLVQSLCQILDEAHPRADRRSYCDQMTFVKDRPGHDRRYAVDCGKIGTTLGWKPSRTFNEGLRETVTWYLANENWWQDILAGTYRGERLGN